MQNHSSFRSVITKQWMMLNEHNNKHPQRRNREGGMAAKVMSLNCKTVMVRHLVADSCITCHSHSSEFGNFWMYCRVSSANCQQPRDQTFSTQQTAVTGVCDELASPAATVVELNSTLYCHHSLTEFYIEYLQELNYKCKINRFIKGSQTKTCKIGGLFQNIKHGQFESFLTVNFLFELFNL